MRALVLHAPGDLRLEEVQVPSPGHGELLLRVETVGICGTDASEYHHGAKLFPLERRHPVTGHLGPMVPGHEFSGRVMAVGAGVEGFSKGELVASTGSAACWTCHTCRSGRPSRCDRYWAVGLQRDGALAEYCTAPADACLEVESAGLTPDAAALAQPMSIAVHALRRARIEGGEEVVVIGAGGIGAFVTYAAARAGCSVVTVDLDRDRLAVAAALGAGTTICVGSDATAGLAASVVLEISGTEAGLRTALSMLAPGGRLVCVGFQKQPLTMNLAELTGQEQEWIGSNGIDTPLDLPAAISLLAARDDSWADVAPSVLPLREAANALDSMASGLTTPIKTLVSPQTDRTRPSLM
jgi:(R,R)-butanediol dehydrogenase/meso-butanediol dehydrogenase/diacetyl reductase